MIDRKNLGGLLAAGIGYSRLQTSPEFQRDMARAQQELLRCRR